MKNKRTIAQILIVSLLLGAPAFATGTKSDQTTAPKTKQVTTKTTPASTTRNGETAHQSALSKAIQTKYCPQ